MTTKKNVRSKLHAPKHVLGMQSRSRKMQHSLLMISFGILRFSKSMKTLWLVPLSLVTTRGGHSHVTVWVERVIKKKKKACILWSKDYGAAFLFFSSSSFTFYCPQLHSKVQSLNPKTSLSPFHKEPFKPNIIIIKKMPRVEEEDPLKPVIVQEQPFISLRLLQWDHLLLLLLIFLVLIDISEVTNPRRVRVRHRKTHTSVVVWPWWVCLALQGWTLNWQQRKLCVWLVKAMICAGI